MDIKAIIRQEAEKFVKERIANQVPEDVDVIEAAMLVGVRVALEDQLEKHTKVD